VCTGVLVRRGRVNGGDEDETIGLMGYIYIKEIETMKSLLIALSGTKRCVCVGGDLTMYNVRVFRIVTTNPLLYNEHKLIKFF
jgi:hypothetical protein